MASGGVTLVSSACSFKVKEFIVHASKVGEAYDTPSKLVIYKILLYLHFVYVNAAVFPVFWQLFDLRLNGQ